MKITKEKLKQMIKEALGVDTGETDRTGQPFDPSGWTDSSKVTWDDQLDHMRKIFVQVAIDVIDYYQEKPEEFGNFTKEDARKEITEVLQATVDNFVNDDLPGTLGLGELLEDEFDYEPSMSPPGNPYSGEKS